MADRIVAAVRLKRKVLEGVEQQADILAIIERHTRKILFRHPDLETTDLRNDIVRILKNKYIPLADESGVKSSVPILDKIGGAEAVAASHPLTGVDARFLSGYRARNLRWFAQEVATNTDALSSELKAEIARAARDGVSRRRMETNVINSYKAEIKQIKKARKRLARANIDVANAEATADIKAIKLAHKERRNAMAATRKVTTAMGRVENNIQGVARDAVRREAQRAQLASYRQAGFTVFTWVSVNGSLACPDCVSLHGTTMSMEQWHGQQPGDGHTVCLDSCVCELVPEKFAVGNESIKEPVNPFLFPAFFEKEKRYDEQGC